MTECNRCKKQIKHDEEESCWYCLEDLCYECWDKYGHCGHKKADEINARAIKEYNK